ncbi:MAG: DUF5989 family protein [Desulfobacteraceae bacterium]|nr:DUF5989 family protein [Desulfobacteraceae bacterium]
MINIEPVSGHRTQRGLNLLRSIWAVLRVNKKYWLLPIVLSVLLIGGLLVLTSQPVFIQVIYALF